MERVESNLESLINNGVSRPLVQPKSPPVVSPSLHEARGVFGKVTLHHVVVALRVWHLSQEFQCVQFLARSWDQFL